MKDKYVFVFGVIAILFVVIIVFMPVKRKPQSAILDSNSNSWFGHPITMGNKGNRVVWMDIEIGTATNGNVIWRRSK